MKKIYTHITVVLDRSGSMKSIRDDIIGGFNMFLDQQKKEPGKATLTLVQFDTEDAYEVVHKFVPLVDIPELTAQTYVPRASTPLLDAMGRAINDIEASVAAMPKKDQPGRVIVVFVTDGAENSSREFTKKQVTEMIKEKGEKQNWSFVFLSADMTAIAEAQKLGVDAGSSLRFNRADKNAISATWGMMACKIAECRGARREKIGFSEEDRRKSAGKK